MTRKYLENAGEAVAAEALPKNDYDIEVVDAHPNPKGGPSIFLDLKVLNGPYEGHVASGISLFVPADGDKAEFYFHQKIAAFAGDLRAVPWASIPDDDELQVIADTLIGLRATASLSIQDKGNYAGKQQLDATKPLDGSAVAVAPVAAAPATIAAAPAAPVAVAPASATIEQQVATADVPAPTPVAVAAAPQPDVPF